MFTTDRLSVGDEGRACFPRDPDSPLFRLVIAEPDEAMILGDRKPVIAQRNNPHGHTISYKRNAYRLVLPEVQLHRRELRVEDDLCLFPGNPLCLLHLQMLNLPSQRLDLPLGLGQPLLSLAQLTLLGSTLFDGFLLGE